MQQTHYETIIEFLLIFLIVFTPLAFGSVQLWSWTIIELVAIFLIFIWVLKMLKQGALTFVRTPLNFLIVIFLALVLIQLLPLPSSFLKSISPSTQNFYTGSGIANWLTDSRLSLSPYATKTEFLKLISYAAIFFVAVNNITSKKQINRLIITIILVGSFEAIYGLLEYLSGHQHIFLYQKKWYTNCVTGTYINRNHFAGYLGMVVPIAVSFALVTLWGPFRDTGLSWRNKLVAMDKYVAKAGLLMFSALLMMVGVMFSTSRLGIFSLVVSLLIMMCLLAVIRKTKVFAWLISVVVGMTVLSATFIGLSPIFKRYSLLSKDLAWAGARPTVWKDTIAIIKDFPILGTGLGTFASVYPGYKSIKAGVTYDHAHNDYLELLAETGVVGGIIVGIAILTIVVSVLKRLRLEASTRRRLIKIGTLTSLIAVAIHSLGDFNLHIPANALLLSLLIALACFCGSEKQVRKFVISGQRTKWILSLALTFCFIAAVIVITKPAIAESFRHKGSKYEKKHNWEQAEKYYQKATKLDLGNPSHQVALARAILFSNGADISGTELYSYMEHLKLATIQQIKNPYVHYLMGYGYILSWTDISEKEKKVAISNLQYSLRMNPRYSIYAYRAIWNKLKDFSLMVEITPETFRGQKTLLDFVQQNGLWQFRREQNKFVERYRETKCPETVKQEKIAKLREIDEFKKQNANTVIMNSPTTYISRKEWEGKSKSGKNFYHNGLIYCSGTIRTCLNFIPGKVIITIMARGSSAKNIYPYMLIDLDEVQIGESAVSGDWENYSFEVETQGGLKVLSVTFINDYCDSKEDRNLYVGDVTVSCLSPNSKEKVNAPVY